jgi:hypothetical protein
MANFGDYTKTEYVNTTAPALNQTNLNNNENKLDLVDEELRRSQTFNLSQYLNIMYQCNTKEIASFQDSTDWTMAVGGTISNDTTNYKLHNQSVKLLEPDNVLGYLCMHRACDLDLEIFPSESASTSADLILLVVYISDVNALTSLYLKLGTDNTDNYYINVAAASLTTGWNYIVTAKSAFTSGGTPPGWDSITYIRCEWLSKANQINKYVSFQYIQMIREDADNAGYYNPFQLHDGSAWENLIDVGTSYRYVLCYDRKYNKLGIQILNPSGDVNMLHLPYHDVSSFIYKCKMICTHAEESQNLVWYVDADNYIQCAMYGDFLLLLWNEAGVDDAYYEVFNEVFSDKDKFELTFEKDGSLVRVIAKLNGITRVLEHITTITDYGCLYLGSMDIDSESLVTDMILSHSQGHDLIEDNKIKVIVKSVTETVNNSDVLQNDNDFTTQLDENSVYEIEVKLAVSGAANADFKSDWVVGGGVEQLTTKACLGPSTATTGNTSTVVRCSNHNLDTAVSYGCDGSTAAYISEKFLVKSIEAGTLTFRWAQNTAQLSDTTISNNSYMKITKVN